MTSGAQEIKISLGQHSVTLSERGGRGGGRGGEEEAYQEEERWGTEEGRGSKDRPYCKTRVSANILLMNSIIA